MIFVDIGNTSIKLKDYGSFSHDCINEKNGDLIQTLLSSDTVVLSSVVPSITTKLLDILKNKKVYIIKRNDPFSFKCSLTGVGIDRLLAVQGALTEFKPPLITVDIGTAVTVNVCVLNSKDNQPEFVSGLIMPGLKLMLKSMNDYTAQLPLLTLASPLQPFGSTTESSMIAGVNHLLIGGVERAINKAKDYYKIKNVNTIITGGSAEYFKTFSQIDSKFCPDLIFKGMGYIFSQITKEEN